MLIEYLKYSLSSKISYFFSPVENFQVPVEKKKNCVCLSLASNESFIVPRLPKEAFNWAAVT